MTRTNYRYIGTTDEATTCEHCGKTMLRNTVVLTMLDDDGNHDEFVRFGLYRNFHDPYEREWRNGNSRWDRLDVMRLWHALRPQGLVWPTRDDGATSFKLEHLAAANDVRTGDAHEALSDVRALIGLARLFRNAQPRLWDYAAKLRDKRHVASMLDTVAMTPVLHVSQRYPASRLCAAPVLPLTRHPRFDSRVVVFDLDGDPDWLLDLDAETIAARVFARRDELPEGVTRIPLKEVHTNRCPALVAWNHLRAADFERLSIDVDHIEQRAERLRAVGPALAEKIRQVFAVEREFAPNDADAALYDGFAGPGDRRRMQQVRATPPAQLGSHDFGFEDPRLQTLLLRYRARNWPETLSADDRQQWDAYRLARMAPGNTLAELDRQAFAERIQALRAEAPDDQRRTALLNALLQWEREVTATLPPADGGSA